MYVKSTKKSLPLLTSHTHIFVNRTDKGSTLSISIFRAIAFQLATLQTVRAKLDQGLYLVKQYGQATERTMYTRKR